MNKQTDKRRVLRNFLGELNRINLELGLWIGLASFYSLICGSNGEEMTGVESYTPSWLGGVMVRTLDL